MWAGSTVGMVAADGLAIVVGRRLGRQLPERAIRIGAAVVFFVLGGALLVDAARQLDAVTVLADVVGALRNEAAAWIAVALAVAATVLVILGRRQIVKRSSSRTRSRLVGSPPVVGSVVVRGSGDRGPRRAVARCHRRRRADRSVRQFGRGHRGCGGSAPRDRRPAPSQAARVRSYADTDGSGMAVLATRHRGIGLTARAR